MFIGYDKKKSVLYAKLLTAHRVNGKPTQEYVSLGRVIDKERGIYQNRERGIYMYDLKTNRYSEAPADVQGHPRRRGSPRLILDFGDVFFLDQFITSQRLKFCMESLEYGNKDRLWAMVHYYVLAHQSNACADIWHEGSYARELFPKADLVSQRISELLAALGREDNLRRFFEAYLKFLDRKLDDGKGSILIDSTGLPNSIHFPLTAVNNHNGEISNEVRLIYVTHQETGLPIYFRYCPGNVIDVSTLATTIAELKAIGINTKFSILDAGYYDKDNVQLLHECKISFVMRLKQNLKAYRDAVAACAGTLESSENLVSYGERFVYIQCVEVELVEGVKAYAYVGLDINRKADEGQKLLRRARRQGMSAAEVHEALEGQGLFVIVASRRIARDRILPVYYTRQQVEQIFDIGKNYVGLTPLRVEAEDTFRGHLLLTFFASVLVKLIQDRLLDTSSNPIKMFMQLRNQKCKVFDTSIIPQEAFKGANDAYKLFGFQCPVEIPRNVDR